MNRISIVFVVVSNEMPFSAWRICGLIKTKVENSGCHHRLRAFHSGVPDLACHWLPRLCLLGMGSKGAQSCGVCITNNGFLLMLYIGVLVTPESRWKYGPGKGVPESPNIIRITLEIPLQTKPPEFPSSVHAS